MGFGQGLDPGSQFTLALMQSLGQQIGQGREQVQEQNVLNELLPRLQQAQDPEQILNLILQSQIQPGLTPGTRQRLSGLAPTFGALEKSRGASELRQAEIERRISQESEKKQEAIRQKAAPLQSGLQTIDRLEQLVKKGNLGLGSGVKSSLFGGETAEDTEEFSRLGKSLIQLSAGGLIVRNKSEFEEFARGLTDPSMREAKLRGVIKGLKRVIEQNLAQILPQENQENRVRVSLNGNTGTIPESQVESFLKQPGARRVQG